MSTCEKKTCLVKASVNYRVVNSCGGSNRCGANPGGYDGKRWRDTALYPITVRHIIFLQFYYSSSPSASLLAIWFRSLGLNFILPELPSLFCSYLCSYFTEKKNSLVSLPVKWFGLHGCFPKGVTEVMLKSSQRCLKQPWKNSSSSNSNSGRIRQTKTANLRISPSSACTLNSPAVWSVSSTTRYINSLST